MDPAGGPGSEGFVARPARVGPPKVAGMSRAARSSLHGARRSKQMGLTVPQGKQTGSAGPARASIPEARFPLHKALLPRLQTFRSLISSTVKESEGRSGVPRGAHISGLLRCADKSQHLNRLACSGSHSLPRGAVQGERWRAPSGREGVLKLPPLWGTLNP